MKQHVRKTSCGALAASALAAAHPAGAAEWAIAHVAPFTGPVAIEAADYNAGIRLAVKAVNAGGGIHGRPVLRSEDDHYNPDRRSPCSTRRVPATRSRCCCRWARRPSRGCSRSTSRKRRSFPWSA